MKFLSLIICLLVCISVSAQALTIAAGGGAGKAYIFEDADAASDVEYSSAISLFMEAGYQFDDSNNRLKIRLQQMQADIGGQDFRTNESVSGLLDTFTVLMMFESLSADRAFNLGYQYGMGYSLQQLETSPGIMAVVAEDRFMSLMGSAIASFRLKESLCLKLEIIGFWTDPISTVRGNDLWQTAGEDLSLLAQIGISYRFKLQDKGKN